MARIDYILSFGGWVGIAVFLMESAAFTNNNDLDVESVHITLRIIYIPKVYTSLLFCNFTLRLRLI